MAKNRSQLVVAGLAILSVGLVFFLYLGMQKNPKDLPSMLVGKPAPDFRASWISGQKHIPNAAKEHYRLSDLRGKTVVLNFWASWCYSCRQEARDLEAFHQLNLQSDIAVVGIAIQDTFEAATGFAVQYGKTYPLGLDDTGSISIDYGVTGVPETFIIDPAGNIVHKEVGPVDVPKLTELVQKSAAH